MGGVKENGLPVTKASRGRGDHTIHRVSVCVCVRERERERERERDLSQI